MLTAQQAATLEIAAAELVLMPALNQESWTWRASLLWAPLGRRRCACDTAKSHSIYLINYRKELKDQHCLLT